MSIKYRHGRKNPLPSNELNTARASLAFFEITSQRVCSVYGRTRETGTAVGTRVGIDFTGSAKCERRCTYAIKNFTMWTVCACPGPRNILVFADSAIVTSCISHNLGFSRSALSTLSAGSCPPRITLTGGWARGSDGRASIRWTLFALSARVHARERSRRTALAGPRPGNGLELSRACSTAGDCVERSCSTNFARGKQQVFPKCACCAKRARRAVEVTARPSYQA